MRLRLAYVESGGRSQRAYRSARTVIPTTDLPLQRPSKRYQRMSSPVNSRFPQYDPFGSNRSGEEPARIRFDIRPRSDDRFSSRRRRRPCPASGASPHAFALNAVSSTCIDGARAARRRDGHKLHTGQGPAPRGRDRLSPETSLGPGRASAPPRWEPHSSDRYHGLKRHFASLLRSHRYIPNRQRR